MRRARARPARGLRGALYGQKVLMRTNRNRRGKLVGRHCCKRLAESVSEECEQHPDRFDCADALLAYWPKYDEYGVIVHDGGSSMVLIAFCPWCGAKLPESKRNRWFDELELRGIDPGADIIPKEYQTDSWWRRPRAKQLKRRTSSGKQRRRVLSFPVKTAHREGRTR